MGASLEIIMPFYKVNVRPSFALTQTGTSLLGNAWLFVMPFSSTLFVSHYLSSL